VIKELIEKSHYEDETAIIIEKLNEMIRDYNKRIGIEYGD